MKAAAVRAPGILESRSHVRSRQPPEGPGGDEGGGPEQRRPHPGRANVLLVDAPDKDPAAYRSHDRHSHEQAQGRGIYEAAHDPPSGPKGTSGSAPSRTIATATPWG